MPDVRPGGSFPCTCLVPPPRQGDEMRPRWMIVVVAVLAVGNSRGEEPAPTAPIAAEAGTPTAGVPESSGVLRGRPFLGSRLATWRPISRWLSRTSAPQ